MNVMVTGGAGYIGSHATKRLLADGHEVVVLDNLQRGHRAAFQALADWLAAGKAGDGAKLHLVEADLLHTDAVRDALQRHDVEAVINFAALAYVGESVQTPLMYYENNTAGVVSLLQAMRDAGVRRIVHSSTCATYGEPDTMPIREDTRQSPINPYGWSKLFNERIFRDVSVSDPGFAFAALRYFNVAGSDPEGVVGEDHDPETHLIPVLLNTALGQRDSATIFGTDYDTPDGTCIRDYIHVVDLVDAHVAVLNHLDPTDPQRRALVYNLGTGQGLSVRQIIDSVKRVTDIDFKVELGDRRPGDPPSLYADPARIANELGWTASITEVDQMVQHAWAWFKRHPNGYAD